MFSFCLSDDQPLIVQFAAHDAQTLADAACVVAPFSNGIDLNCGCPQRCMNTCCALIALQYYNGPTENHHACRFGYSSSYILLCCCVLRWAMSAGYGACLINKPELVKDMVRHVRNQVDNPDYTVSIKIR